MRRLFAFRNVTVVATAIALAAWLSSAAVRADDDDPVITSAVPTITGTTGTLTITGSNFDPRALLHVMLNGLSLTARAWISRRTRTTAACAGLCVAWPMRHRHARQGRASLWHAAQASRTAT